MIEQTFDFREVSRLADEPPVISKIMIFLLEVEKGKQIGLWTFHPYEDGVQIHADMTTHCRGRKAIASARSAFNWVFKNTNYDIIYARIPENKKGACQIASRAGMKFNCITNGDKFYEVRKWAA